MSNMIPLRDVKPGALIKRKPDANPVYVKQHYNRSDKTFTCSDWSDIGRCIFIKADRLVCVDFDF